MRDFVIAARDPSLYYLQFVLVLVFGFLIGAGFFQLGFEINSRITNVPSGLLWIVMLMCYVLIFKVCHLSRSNIRFKHEASNNTYSVFAYWLAELTTTSILLVSFTPGGVIAYFMMGLPSKAYPFLILLFWLTALTGESVLNLITKLTTNVEVTIVACLTTLVLLNVFGSGLFIAWNRCPDYWVWLQELALFTQSSRSALMDVLDHTVYTCKSSSDTCIGPFGETYPCDVSSFSNGECKISGRMMLHVQQGTIITESKWVSFLYLLLIFICVRLSLLFLLYYPIEKVKFWIMSTFMLSNVVNKDVNKFAEIAVIDKNGGSSMTVSAVDSIATNTKDMKESLFEEGSDQTGHIIASGCCLEWRNLSVVLKKKGTVLIDNVSGIALSGRILALMGPSGAGKTTLLNALSNRAPYAELIGEVTFGKRPFTPTDLVYVPQFDEFNQDLTVYEQIELVGNLKCIDRKDMYDRLDKLISIIGMTSKQHTSCKNLTSGELKRVSVGMGMIANPCVLFLDEPTTGLDSSAAYSIVKFLCSLSEATNVVVIMTIHQPAQPVFDMLQDLYILENGRLAFFGPLNSAERYFAMNHHVCPVGINPADFYLDLVNKMPYEDTSTVVTWCDVYHRSTFYKNYRGSLFGNYLHPIEDQDFLNSTV